MFMWPFFYSILENLRELAEGCLGRLMLYELIEVNLSKVNISLFYYGSYC